MIFYPLSTIHYSLCHAEEPVSKEPIVVNGDKVEYFHESKQVVGTGNISITYKDVVLTCKKITVHLDTREALAEGDVKVTQKDAFFTGDTINYNFDTRKGTVVNGYVNSKPFYGRAEAVDKIANKDQFNLERGYVTTCDLDKPHYRIQSRQVKIYLDDKVVAKHILLFVGNMPVLYMPYYVQPLDQPKSHVTLIPGESKDWGYYLLSAYRYYLNDDNRGDILLDYRTKKGLAGGVNHYIDTKDVGNGAFKFYYTRENELVYQKVDPARTRYRYQYRHRWDMPELDTVATVEFNKLSDRDIIKDYFYNEYQELGQPDNYISVITTKKSYSTQFLTRARFDKFFTVVERLPEYDINVYNYKIGDTPIYYQAQASAVYLNEAFDNTNTFPGRKDINTARVDAYNQLAYAGRLFKAWSITPYAGVRETYYSRNKWGATNEIRTIFNAGLDNSIKFYKIFDVETNYMGLDIHGLRHIITPTVNYYYTHQPTISVDNLNQFDGIDALDTTNGVRLALENRLQTKRLNGENMSSVDLATLIVSTDYMFRLERNNWNIKEDKLNNINFQLELVPYSWAYLESKMSVNPKKNNVETMSIDLVANGNDKWNLAMSYRFEDTTSGTSDLITLDGMYKITDKWRARIYERFDSAKGSLEEQEYTIYRDLHCWIGEFTCNIKNLQDTTFWFIMRLKAFPEYQVGLKRTYSRPRFGSTGTP